MNGIDDLRRTLDQHAGRVHDDGLAVRRTQVHQRVRRLRRQRVAGVGVAAVLAVAATSAVSLWPDDGGAPSPADRRLVGKLAPATLGSLGYTYAFDHGVVGGPDRTIVRLSASDQPRLISWGSRDDAAALKVVDPSREVVLSEQHDFSDFTLVQPGEEGTWTVHGDDTAAAVYDLTSARPAGQTVDGITFRDRLAGATLLSSRIGGLGQADVGGESPTPAAGQVGLAWFCAGGPRGTWVHARVAGGLTSFGSSCDDDIFDPGASIRATFDPRTSGDTMAVRVWATDGRRGPVLRDPDVRLGYGVYEVDVAATRLAGSNVPQVIEHDGHEWSLGPVTVHTGSVRARAEGPHQQLVVVYFAGRKSEGRVRTFLGGQEEVSYGGGGRGSGQIGLAAPGDLAVARMQGGDPSTAELAIAFYERVD